MKKNLSALGITSIIIILICSIISLVLSSIDLIFYMQDGLQVIINI